MGKYSVIVVDNGVLNCGVQIEMDLMGIEPENMWIYCKWVMVI
jgi:hypothetical protein